MLSPGALSVLLLFGLPILAVVAWVYIRQLEITSRSGDDNRTRDLERTLAALEQKVDEISEERDDLQRRIQNLETIVTSESWDEMHTRRDEGDNEDTLDQNSAPSETRSSSVDDASAGTPPERSETDADRAARQADRLRRSS